MTNLADDIAIEMARLVRECEERVARKLAEQQLGELYPRRAYGSPQSLKEE